MEVISCIYKYRCGILTYASANENAIRKKLLLTTLFWDNLSLYKSILHYDLSIRHIRKFFIMGNNYEGLIKFFS